MRPDEAATPPHDDFLPRPAQSGRWQLELPILITMAVAGTVALWWLSGGAPVEAFKALVALGGAAAAAYLVPRRPVAAVGVVFLLACFSRVVIDLPVGTMRLEQPAIAFAAVAVAVHRRRLRLASMRSLAPLIGAALLYLVVLGLSSAFVAEQPLDSLRMVAWTALSMIAGLLAALLVAGRAASVLPWLSGSAAIVALIGVAVAVTFFLFGTAPLIDGVTGRSPKVNALVHEANLYASLLGAAIIPAVELFRRRPAIGPGAVLALLLVAIGLGVTRGAYVGLAVGLVAYFGISLVRAGPRAALARAAAIVLAAGVAGLLLPSVLLDPSPAGVVEPPDRPAATARPSQPANELATWEYRMERVRAGIDDFKTSPLIGRGAFSYGQRHASPRGLPDSIAVLPVAVLHDAGVLGLGALSAFFAMLGLRAWRASADEHLAGPAVALVASVVVLLAAYLATTALHFAVTWLILGCAAGATLVHRRPDASVPVRVGAAASRD